MSFRRRIAFTAAAAVAVAVAIGSVVSYPALRAARLSPTEALRSV
jgi:ABC-type antimicrobial peptide transport system permease subunit